MRSIMVVVVVLAALGGGVALVFGLVGQSQTIVQPIAFNHTLHLTEAGLQCMECHKDAARDVYAGLPGKNICLDCHDIDEEAADATPEKAKLFAFADQDQEIPWVRVALTRPDVFFSHRRHVTAAKLDCLRCHSDQPSLLAPPPRARLVMRMAQCLQCHQENGVTQDCVACHR